MFSISQASDFMFNVAFIDIGIIKVVKIIYTIYFLRIVWIFCNSTQ